MRPALLTVPALLLLLAGGAPAEVPGDAVALGALAARLETGPVVRADFRQERLVRLLSRPLASSGRMVVARDRGVIWQILDPYPIDVLLLPDRLIEREAGQPPRVLPLAAMPGFGTLMPVFLSLLTGAPEVGDRFEATLEEAAGDRWSLTLTPLEASLGAALAAIEVRGARFVEEIVLREPGGDLTRITFSRQAIDAAGLSAAEAALFRD